MFISLQFCEIAKAISFEFISPMCGKYELTFVGRKRETLHDRERNFLSNEQAAEEGMWTFYKRTKHKTLYVPDSKTQ